MPASLCLRLVEGPRPGQEGSTPLRPYGRSLPIARDGDAFPGSCDLGCRRSERVRVGGGCWSGWLLPRGGSASTQPVGRGRSPGEVMRGVGEVSLLGRWGCGEGLAAPEADPLRNALTPVPGVPFVTSCPRGAREEFRRSSV